jgi:hypothetical protein
MQPVLKRGNDTEISATAPQTSKEVRVLVPINGEKIAVRRDEIGGDQVVEYQPTSAGQVAPSASQRKPSDARRGNLASCRRQTESLGFAIEFTPCNPSFGACGPLHRIYPDALHPR